MEKTNTQVNKRELLIKASILFLIALTSFVFSLQSSNDIWQKGNTYTDSSVFKYVARVILSGGMPYVDTFDHKGPLLYLINVLGTLIAEWQGVWVFQYIAIFLTFLYIYKVARIYTRRSISFLILLISSYPLFTYYEGGNLTEEYAMPFISISIYIFVDYFTNLYVNAFRLVICGFCFGAILMLRPNMCAVWIVMCLGVLVHCIGSKNLRQIGPFIAHFFMGAFVLIAPIVLWLIANGAFGAFIECYIIFNIKYSSCETIDRVNSFAHFLNQELVLLSICGLFCVWFRKRSYFDILYLTYMVSTLLLICTSGQQFDHYGMVLVPALSFPLARMFSVMQENTPPRILFNFLILGLFVIFAAPVWIGGIQNVFKEYNEKDELHIGIKEIEIMDFVVKNSTENDKIIVLGNYDIIYNLSHRFAASKYSYPTSPLIIDSDREEEFYQEIEANKPAVIVVPAGAYASDWILQYIERNNYYEAGKTSDQSVTIYSQSQ